MDVLSPVTFVNFHSQFEYIRLVECQLEISALTT